MLYTVSVRPHRATLCGLKPETRSARPYTFFLLWLCAFACGAFDTYASGACTTPTFAPASVYGAGQARRIVSADFNRDGKLDFAALNYGISGTITLYLGDGAGAFSPFPISSSPTELTLTARRP
jgi:hypothetical protein